MIRLTTPLYITGNKERDSLEITRKIFYMTQLFCPNSITYEKILLVLHGQHRTPDGPHLRWFSTLHVEWKFLQFYGLNVVFPFLYVYKYQNDFEQKIRLYMSDSDSFRIVVRKGVDEWNRVTVSNGFVFISVFFPLET